MFGEWEVQVAVDTLECADGVVHNILISHTDVSTRSIVLQVKTKMV